MVPLKAFPWRLFNQQSRGSFRSTGAGRMLAAHNHRLPGACIILWNRTGWSPAFFPGEEVAAGIPRVAFPQQLKEGCDSQSKGGSTGDRVPETCSFHRQGGPAVCSMGLEAPGMVNRTVFRAGSLTRVFVFGVFLENLPKGLFQVFLSSL